MTNIGQRYRHSCGMIIEVIDIKNKGKVLIKANGFYKIGHEVTWGDGGLGVEWGWRLLPNQGKI